MLIKHLITESENDLPIWFGLIQRGLEQGRKFYFASGGNRIVGISVDGKMITLILEHISKKQGGKPLRQVYAIYYGRSANLWTLKKHEDGHRLTMVKD